MERGKRGRERVMWAREKKDGGTQSPKNGKEKKELQTQDPDNQDVHTTSTDLSLPPHPHTLTCEQLQSLTIFETYQLASLRID